MRQHAGAEPASWRRRSPRYRTQRAPSRQAGRQRAGQDSVADRLQHARRREGVDPEQVVSPGRHVSSTGPGPSTGVTAVTRPARQTQRGPAPPAWGTRPVGNSVSGAYSRRKNAPTKARLGAEVGEPGGGRRCGESLRRGHRRSPRAGSSTRSGRPGAAGPGRGRGRCLASGARAEEAEQQHADRVDDVLDRRASEPGTAGLVRVRAMPVPAPRAATAIQTYGGWGAHRCASRRSWRYLQGVGRPRR